MDYKKVPQQINDVVGDNVKKLAQLFPSAVKDGEVDFEALKEELGSFTEVGTEKYELTWAGKADAKRIAREDIVGKTLKYIPEDSKDADTTENLYIEGDNLEVLKLLRQNYYSAIKMIYIDPPYNTGSDFIYNDSFFMSKSESDILEGVVNELGERFVINTKSQNRFHATWMNMIYPRLQLAKDLLTDDGVIFISIDDNEVFNMKLICDEIFGSSNFVVQLAVQLNPRGRNLDVFVAKTYESVLVYAKNYDEASTITGVEKEGKMIEEYNKEDENGKYRAIGLRNRNQTFNPITRPNLYYPLYVCPKTQRVAIELSDEYTDEVFPDAPDGTKTCWTWAKNKVEQENELIIAERTEDEWRIYRKDYLLKNGEVATTLVKSLWTDNTINNDYGKKAIKELFGSNVMSFPKAPDLLKKMLKIGTEKDSFVLDFFSGSSTTAQSIFELNVEDGGNRKFIMVQLPEICDKTSDAYKSGLKTICEIGKERIRRAGDKIKSEHPDADIDIGFKAFRVADTNIKWNSLMNIGQLDISHIESTPDLMDFMPNTKDIDVVYELMLRQRDVALSESMELLSDIGSRTYLYASSFLVCLETEVTESLVEKVAAIDPLPIKFIFRDSAFKDDIALKDETFRRLKALVEKNSGESKPAYTVEFI